MSQVEYIMRVIKSCEDTLLKNSKTFDSQTEALESVVEILEGLINHNRILKKVYLFHSATLIGIIIYLMLN